MIAPHQAAQQDKTKRTAPLRYLQDVRVLLRTLRILMSKSAVGAFEFSLCVPSRSTALSIHDALLFNLAVLQNSPGRNVNVSRELLNWLTFLSVSPTSPLVLSHHINAWTSSSRGSRSFETFLCMYGPSASPRNKHATAVVSRPLHVAVAFDTIQ